MRVNDYAATNGTFIGKNGLDQQVSWRWVNPTRTIAEQNATSPWQRSLRMRRRCLHPS